MKTLPIQSIIQNIERFNQKVILKSGQIFSGKVLALFPGNFAEIQLAGKRLTAQLDTGLSMDKQYLFQVQTNKSDELPLLKVLGRNDEASMLRILGQKSSSPAIKSLLQTLAEEQIPITKELLGKTEKWIDDSKSLDRSIQAIKMMIIKNYPPTESVFRALYQVQEQEPLVVELRSLKDTLQSSSKQTKILSDVQAFIQRLLTITNQDGALSGVKQLLQLAVDTNENLTVKEAAQKLLNQLKILPLDKSTHAIGVRSDKGGQLSDQALLKILNLNMTVPEAESHIQKLISKLNNEDWQQYTQLTDRPSPSSPKLSLVELVKGLGLTIESDLIHKQLNELNKTGQLKAVLLEILDMDLPLNIREKVEALVNRITGQQLIHSSENQSFTSLFYQLPIQFNEWKSDILMRWDTKKEANGKIDENYSRILFYLDLSHLNETIIDMNVQNRIISIKIINENEELQSLVSSLKDPLKEKLGQLEYILSSVKVEKPALEVEHRKNYNAIDVGSQGVDFSI
ncbi:hypothetical protein [Alkalihalobacillus sp. AL-G]|uniref:hypothetical protein n=1 Tax=Alkalihalobacillus sp. AL-G TaxID=2926399 RepID=UPI00272A0267|nr:hypothetical protein [Alkalihalobacillus sp. AL-G]WLD95135.1 hypothetical protein MOJ78_09735 [Alkalihalobacillus sp. AL-G]